MKTLILVLLAIAGGSWFYAVITRRKILVLIEMLAEERTRQRSISASYGRITEQWFPLMDRYPYDAANFRFLGSPVDGIQFEEDRVVFVEFKARKSELSAAQKRIKQLVRSGKVKWEEFHFNDDGG
jgi:predicted Holliday junction resolvase-like endonuclease